MIDFVRPHARVWRALTGAALLVLLSAGGAVAAGWSATNVRGTVLSLVDRKWEDVASGQSLEGNVVLRTLGSGRLSLAASGAAISLGGSATVEVAEDGTGIAVLQHAGNVGIAVEGARTVTVTASGSTVVFSNARVQISLSGGVARIEVQAGAASVSAATGGSANLAPGQVARVSAGGLQVQAPNGAVVTPADGRGPAVPAKAGGNAAADQAAGESANPAASSNAGGNAGNNSAGNSNSGGASGANAGGGNAGGGGPGNSQGNDNPGGNSNAGGNAGGNSSGAGGNPGGNGD